VRVRRREDADLQVCAALLLRVRDATGYPVNLPEDPVAWIRGDVLAWSAEVAPGEIVEVRGSHQAWVAELEGGIVGHVALHRRANRTAAVERLYVDPDHARAGIGSALLRTAADAARDTGWSLVLEAVDRPGGPLPFYAALGWREVGRSHVDWTDHELVHLEPR